MVYTRCICNINLCSIWKMPRCSLFTACASLQIHARSTRPSCTGQFLYGAVQNILPPDNGQPNHKRFLWIILVDPHFYPTMMDELKWLIAPHPHFFIIRKNSFDINLEDLNLSLVESGYKQLLVRAAHEMRSKVLVETWLDADDGLANVLLDHMQNKASEAFQGWSASANEQGWMGQCI